MDAPSALAVIGHLVKAARLERGMTVRDLAARAQVSVGTVSHLENGLHVPSSLTMARVIAALCLDAARAAALWELHAALHHAPPVTATSHPVIVLRTINELAALRFQAWLRGEPVTARRLEAECERLWDVYRRARSQKGVTHVTP